MYGDMEEPLYWPVSWLIFVEVVISVAVVSEVDGMEECAKVENLESSQYSRLVGTCDTLLC